MAIKIIIATCGEDYAIGKDNKLLTHVPEDLRYFKKQTENQVVVMGNTTMKSLQALGMENGLPNRHNVVLSRTPKKSPFLHEGALTHIGNLDRFLEWGVLYINNILHKDVFIIGGASVYEQFKDIVDEVHWTQINKSFTEADTFFDMSWVEDTNTFEKVSEEILCDIATVKVYRRLEDKNE